MLDLATVLNEYPNPMFIIEPIVENNISRNFIYRFVNKAFCLFIGHDEDELLNHTFLSVFESGEDVWFNAFYETVLTQKITYREETSTIIDKKLFMEMFPIGKSYCACVIHNYDILSKDIGSSNLEYSQLFFIANRDSLTGLYNRHYLKEVEASLSRNPMNLGLIYLDINNLKKVNDTQGHVAGDRYIQNFTRCMKTYFPQYEIFRLSGDEFLVLGLKMDKEAFIEETNKFKSYLEDTHLAAIGFSYFENTSDLSTCISICDQLMYQHKKQMKLR